MAQTLKDAMENAWIKFDSQVADMVRRKTRPHIRGGGTNAQGQQMGC